MVFARPGADAGHRPARDLQRTAPRRRARLVGNAAVYAVFLIAGSLLARVGARAPRASRRRRRGSRSAVIGLFLRDVGAQRRPHRRRTCAWLEGVRIDRELAATWRPLLSTQPRARVRDRDPRLPRGDRRRRRHRPLRRHPHRLLAPAARPAPGRAPRRDRAPARRRRPGAARRPRAHHPRLPRRPRSHDRAPLRRRRPLRAADRRGGRVLGLRAAPGPHRRALPRRRQGHVRRPHVQGRQADRRGVGDRQAPPRARRRARRAPAQPRGRGRRSSSPTTSASTAAAIRAASPARTSRACRA